MNTHRLAVLLFSEFSARILCSKRLRVFSGLHPFTLRIKWNRSKKFWDITRTMGDDTGASLTLTNGLLSGRSLMVCYDTVLMPDIVVVCDRSKIKKQSCIGAPDLVIGILSPSTSWKNMGDKLKLYKRAGVRECRIVDPDMKSCRYICTKVITSHVCTARQFRWAYCRAVSLICRQFGKRWILKMTVKNCPAPRSAVRVEY
ncbi:MAG: Uma2 family endonuclease [Treponema sp.]|nr:Uma2 family endonuclease [Treponema sp.]